MPPSPWRPVATSDSSQPERRPHPIGQPAYMVESVHNALILLNAIRDQGTLRLKDAATEIKSAESTAHRLLATLAYHDFVVRDEQRHYRPGPALGLGPAPWAAARPLRDRCFPVMVDLASETGEMITLVVRTGVRVRIIATVESTRTLRVGSRQGHVPPAHSTSGGRALLAELTDDEVRSLYASRTDEDRLGAAELDELCVALAAARRSGFSMQVDVKEPGATSIGRALRNARGQALGALNVALPTARLRDSLDNGLLAHLERAVQRVAPAVADLDQPPTKGPYRALDPSE